MTDRDAGVEKTDTWQLLHKEAVPAEENLYWTDAGGEHRQVECDCGAQVDIDGPLEDAHFVFSLRRNTERIMGMERSNLGDCPVVRGFDQAVAKARWRLGIGKVYYRGHLL